MKKNLLIIFFLPIIVFSQRPEVRIRTEIFTVVYSEVYQQPLSIEYVVLCPNGSASRKGMDFYKNDSVITSDDADYRDNVYDKGHLAPAAAFSCNTEMLRQTFSYLNCALQNQYLNRGVWKNLESHERKLAVQNPGAKVEVLVEFKNSKRLPTGATIPSGFYKKITVEKGIYMYYFPNEKPRSSKYSDYVIKKWPK